MRASLVAVALAALVPTSVALAARRQNQVLGEFRLHTVKNCSAGTTGTLMAFDDPWHRECQRFTGIPIQSLFVTRLSAHCTLYLYTDEDCTMGEQEDAKEYECYHGAPFWRSWKIAC
ncbi:uncharacterized protein MAM_02660 [Metarhizium album ARSEF 1941]|uniref:Uncharacterized protein n=1 Tax=Metarhizium album (strain ARSEF 1941) TaxID=1081103 RepID=A0A0B2X268_METAS|nr:uncharacterized protein MAM_02660 [Metarhizium album ARSEF 1941]KHN99807.1 hypothetical protein MAM_02660 [Metarhizium album ARSEF 1941]